MKRRGALHRFFHVEANFHAPMSWSRNFSFTVFSPFDYFEGGLRSLPHIVVYGQDH